MNKIIKNILILAVSTLVISGCEQKEQVIKKIIKPVKTLEVKITKNILNYKSPGTVRAAKRAILSFDVPGRIIFLNAKEGSEIKKGDILSKLDKSDYENNYLSAKANLKEAKLTLTRYKNLFRQKAIARANLDKAQKSYDMAKANAGVSKKALQDTNLKAYFSGTISVRHVENFKNVQAKEAIVSIEDKSNLEIIINVPEKLIATSSKENILSMHATFESISNKKFPLIIKEISTKADSATRTYTVVLSMKAPKNYNIFSGMTADVEVSLSTNNKKNKILVPSTSIFSDSTNNSFVWIYSNKTKSVSKREVTIGSMSGSEIEITLGLEEKEIIVTAGVNYLVEGMIVRPLTGKIGE